MKTSLPHVPYAVCPHCHTSVPLARFEDAVCGAVIYRVCPECDHTVVARSPLSAVAQVEPEQRTCSTSA